MRGDEASPGSSMLGQVEGIKMYPFRFLTAPTFDSINPIATHVNLKIASAGFCPGFSECLVFSAGMKIVVDKNLENTIYWQCF
jgi:hypothetical protein